MTLQRDSDYTLMTCFNDSTRSDPPRRTYFCFLSVNSQDVCDLRAEAIFVLLMKLYSALLIVVIRKLIICTVAGKTERFLASFVPLSRLF